MNFFPHGIGLVYFLGYYLCPGYLMPEIVFLLNRNIDKFDLHESQKVDIDLACRKIKK